MFLFEIPPQRFNRFTLLAQDVLGDGVSDPTLIFNYESEAYEEFRSLCLDEGATQPIMWEIPQSAYPDPDDWLDARYRFFGDEDQDKWSLACNDRAPFDAMQEMRGPATILAVLHGCSVLIEIDGD
jgi:hypothetical protein